MLFSGIESDFKSKSDVRKLVNCYQFQRSLFSIKRFLRIYKLLCSQFPENNFIKYNFFKGALKQNRFLVMTSNTSSATAGNSSIALSEERFHGVLDISKKRLLRRTFFEYIHYIYSQYRPRQYFLIVISFWRCLQFLIPGFFGGNTELYPKGELIRSIIGAFTIINQIVPATIESYYYPIFAGVYIAVYALYLFISTACIIMLDKTGKIPTFLCAFLVIFYEGPWLVMQPIIFTVSGNQIGRKFILEKDTGDAVTWIFFILVLLMHVLITILSSGSTTVSLTFRPTSLSSYHFKTQVLIMQCACLLGFISGINPFCSRSVRFVLIVILMILNVVSLLPYFGHFSIIKESQLSFYVSNILLSMFGSLIVLICEIIEKPVPPITLLIDVLVLVLSYITFIIFHKKHIIKSIRQLEAIEADQDSFRENKLHPFIALKLGIIGFSQSHPFVLTWDYFRLLNEKYPRYEPIYVIWARFVSAFPEEIGQLLMIDKIIKKLKLHKDYIAHFRSQIVFLARQREGSMTHVLKRKINNSMREIQFAKNRLRHFWECVIQGNIVDMQAAAAAAQESVQNAEFDLLHLLNSYPNNQYVARIFSRFLLNVKGDRLEYKVWHQHCDTLKSGQKINPDMAQQETLALFPNILATTVQKQNLTIVTGLFGESTTSVPSISSSSIRLDDDDEDQSVLLSSVRESIRRMKIPAISCTRVLLAIYIVIFLVICIPALIIIYFIRAGDQIDIVYLISYASELRISVSNLALVSSLYISDVLKISLNPAYTPDLNNLNETTPYLGSSTDRKIQISTLMDSVDKFLDDIREITKFNFDKHPMVGTAHSYVFDSIHSVRSVTNVKDDGTFSWTDEKKSAESAIISIRNTANKIVAITDIDEMKSFLKLGDMSNMFINLNVSNDGLDNFCYQLSDYVIDNIHGVNKFITIASYVTYGIVAVLTIIMIIYVNVEIRREKRIIVKAFLTLPKHIISKIVDTLKISGQQEVECDTSNSEIGEIQRNKQEENFLALLGTTSTASSVIFNGITVVALVILLAAAISCVLIYLATYWMKDSSKVINYAAPDANYFLSCVSNFVMSILTYYRLVFHDLGFGLITDSDRSLIVNLGKYYINVGTIQYFGVIYGNESLGLTELCKFDASMAETLSSYGNPDSLLETLSLHGVYSNLSPDSLVVFFSIQMPRLFVVGEFESQYIGSTVTYLSEMILNHIFDNFYAPISRDIPEITRGLFNNKLTNYVIYVLLFYILIIIFLFIAFIIIAKLNNNLKWMTETLLQCPPEVLMNSKQILRLITGRFKEKRRFLKSGEQGDMYFETLIDKFIDAVIFVKPDLTITSVNPATSRIIGMEPEAMIGQHLTHILKDTEDHQGGIVEFIEQLKDALAGRRSLNINCNIEVIKSDGSTVNLNINTTALTKKGIVENLLEIKLPLKSITIVARDISQSVRSKKLLKEERARSDGLLRHILPPMVVDSLQRGEKEVSFAVTSATIVFIDIVEFTPWCASNTATTVMSTLNRMFKEFDWILSLHPTLTKMKCIGDCYMAAGGIFDDPNIPSLHAKEMTHFGCLAIKAILKINSEIGQSLRIRVGINTGGPIAAGVLGVDRPTFEIFGPTINMAQQMEHHGVPMMVHVSRAVYELIFGGEFHIRERGEIEVKNGTVMTYLVDPANVPYPKGGP
ncbi:hypothetical protein TRFO_32897 [Tritrichomonas foetus]|uniref:Adenylate and Guanylate cyclase catalytic domain containing protein n=1 Tax=Tritrichomonas foetus TaxID=1144522 RepID=A0A1J4JPU8_9EUKA|nr:hypothetical protein TRFO_32897 [Tritrichomonas foetus]|eukprot:OHT00440.1 hypothetical protein TRFO_32897 [Tritrichomonas foetus]